MYDIEFKSGEQIISARVSANSYDEAVDLLKQAWVNGELNIIHVEISENDVD